MKYLGIVLGLAVVVGGGYYLYTNMPAPQAQEEEMQQEETETQTNAGTGTFADLMARGGSWQCSVSVEQGEGVSSNGMAYISGSEIRGDFESSVSGQVYGSHMLQTGGYIYTWSDMAPQGFRMPVMAAGEADTSASAQGFDASAGVTYDCQPWAADTSRFAVPEGVTFADAPTAPAAQ